MEADPSPRNVERYSRAQDEFASSGGYAAESEARSIMAGLGLPPDRMDLPIGVLSGGERRRVELSRILFAGSDVLLLDEPTNHLDVDAKTWLLQFMRNYRGALMVISHDLELLDEAITRVMHLDRPGEENLGNSGRVQGHVHAVQDGACTATKNCSPSAPCCRPARSLACRPSSIALARRRARRRWRTARKSRSRASKRNVWRSAPATERYAFGFPIRRRVARRWLPRGLSKAYGGPPVFEDVNFDLGHQARAATPPGGWPARGSPCRSAGSPRRRSASSSTAGELVQRDVGPRRAAPRTPPRSCTARASPAPATTAITARSAAAVGVAGSTVIRSWLSAPRASPGLDGRSGVGSGARAPGRRTGHPPRRHCHPRRQVVAEGVQRVGRGAARVRTSPRTRSSSGSARAAGRSSGRPPQVGAGSTAAPVHRRAVSPSTSSSSTYACAAGVHHARLGEHLEQLGRPGQAVGGCPAGRVEHGQHVVGIARRRPARRPRRRRRPRSGWCRRPVERRLGWPPRPPPEGSWAGQSPRARRSRSDRSGDSGDADEHLGHDRAGVAVCGEHRGLDQFVGDPDRPGRRQRVEDAAPGSARRWCPCRSRRSGRRSAG